MTVTDYVYSKLRDNPKQMENYTTKNGIVLPHRRIYLSLKKHVDSFLKGNRENRLIILPGLRGIGKTTSVFQIYKYLLEERKISQDSMLYVSVDEIQTSIETSLSSVINTFVEDVHKTTLVGLKEEIFIFIDEAHFDNNWSKTIKTIFDSTENIFIIVTGSSALSLELGIDTARRAKKEPLFPLNFSEYVILKYNVYPPEGTAPVIRKVLFSGDDDSILDLEKTENKLKKNMLSLPRSFSSETNDFINYGGFAFGLRMKPFEVHERVSDMLNRIVQKDVPTVKAFNTETYPIIMRSLAFLSLQKPGGTSQIKLAKSLHVSPTMINQILDSLEKTQTIFSVKPFGGAGKTVRKPWKYYFLTPTICASLRSRLGKFDERDRNAYGILVENTIASYIFRMKEVMGNPGGIFYDPNEGGVDFLLQDTIGQKTIPVEVGLNKSDKQVRIAIKRHNSEYGILITNEELTRKDENVIHIPLSTFLFV